MRAVRWLLILALAAFFLPVLARGQSKRSAQAAGPAWSEITWPAVSMKARNQVLKVWVDDYAHNKYATEEGLCADGYMYPLDDQGYGRDSIPAIDSFVPPKHTFYRRVNAVSFTCPTPAPGRRMWRTHFHGPAACTDDGKTCTFDTIFRNQCAPSDYDVAYVQRDPWDGELLVCDAHAILFYRPLQPIGLTLHVPTVPPPGQKRLGDETRAGVAPQALRVPPLLDRGVVADTDTVSGTALPTVTVTAAPPTLREAQRILREQDRYTGLLERRLDSLRSDYAARHSGLLIDGTPYVAAAADTSDRVSLKAIGAILGTAVVAVKVFGIDHDPCPNGKQICLKGTYPDSWHTKQPFSDKAWHALSEYAITDLCIDLTDAKWRCGALALGTGIAFEAAQGYMSWPDIQADGLGVGTSIVGHITITKVRAWRARRKQRTRHP